jgi:hypothetical protein
MGQEVECRMRMGGRTIEGKAYLETDHVLFRGDARLKVPLRDLRGVKASDGVLTLEFEGGPAELELGKAADRWAAKILHPPSRAEKLGLKPGMKVRLAGEFEPDFREELRDCAMVSRGADLVFYAAERREDLERVAQIAPAGGALWVVYPKGAAAIREAEVIAAGRAAGLKDVKVARFSEKRTALKFVR